MAVESARSEPILDIERTLARFGGDKKLFIEMSGIVLEDVPHVFAELRRAVAAKNAKDVRAHAHSLRGLMAGCGGVRASNVAQSLEDAAHAGDLSNADTLVESLENEFDQLTRALKQFCG